MSIRVKLVITYIIVLFISVNIILFSGMNFVAKAIRESTQSVINNQTLEEAIRRVFDIIVDLRYMEKYEPTKLTNVKFAQDIAEDINEFKGFLLIGTHDKYSAYGIENIDEELLDIIKASEKRLIKRLHDNESYIIDWNSKSYVVIKYDFPDYQNDLAYYILVDIDDVKNIGNQYKGGFVIAIILVALIIIAPIIWITTKDIVLPLRKLEKGSREISSGNLNFHIDSKSNNEIGRVIRAYEKMRYELKKSINSQLQLEENRKQLISNISHDLKTPITSIKGYVEGIRDVAIDNPQKLDKYLAVIYTKSNDMDTMIDDLFLFSKLDLNKEIFNKELVNIRVFYNNCIDELCLEFDEKEIEITSDCKVDSDLKIYIDSQKIKRVILNIVNNAVRYMSKDKKLLNILFLQQNGYWVVQITDNGIGISSQDINKIFERFYRSEPSRNRNTGGTGLGLAIAHQIILQHNGSMEAKSEEGMWTTITFRIPLIKKGKFERN